MPMLALDAGTTSIRACVYGDDGGRWSVAQEPLTQHYPESGWVEHDAVEIFERSVRVMRAALARVNVGAKSVCGLGITNQRETVVLWDRRTGLPVHRALVWQDRRTGETCRRLRDAGKEPMVAARTGLLLDPYFSATKLAWLLDQVPGARARAAAGELLAGTIDTWLIWRLTGGSLHATDATNASRTLLCGLRDLVWDEELCRLFAVDARVLPGIRDSVGAFASTTPDLLGVAIPIRAVVGDQQAAAVGQACVVPGRVKATYGTGCFVLAHTGTAPVSSRHRLLGTCALRVQGRSTYALEGSIFNAGTVVQWMRDEMGLITDAAQTAGLAASVPDSHGVHVVPAFTGLGAPWWDPEARGLIDGLTRDTTRAHVVRAGLESVAYQTQDLIRALLGDGAPVERLRVDGGMVANDWFCQFLADQLGLPVDRPVDVETTVRGAAYLAGMASGVLPPLERAEEWWRLERAFTPGAGRVGSEGRYAGWCRAVERARFRASSSP